jgi:hypothetical protein
MKKNDIKNRYWLTQHDKPVTLLIRVEISYQTHGSDNEIGIAQ